MFQVLHTKAGIKTKDLCTSKSAMTINVTHWDKGHNFVVVLLTDFPCCLCLGL